MASGIIKCLKSIIATAIRAGPIAQNIANFIEIPNFINPESSNRDVDNSTIG